MRAELRTLSEDDYWLYGPSESDFDHTLTLARSLVAAQRESYLATEDRIRASEPELANDIVDDIAYYTYVDSHYVWHFALWRLQAVFEALIVRVFLKRSTPKGLVGLSAKVAAMRQSGFALSLEEQADLEAWARVRNSLSHAPPEQANPGPLIEDDVVEYKGLVEHLCARWRTEMGDANQQLQPTARDGILSAPRLNCGR